MSRQPSPRAFAALTLSFACLALFQLARAQQPTPAAQTPTTTQTPATAQAPPDTDIFVVELKSVAGKIEFSQPANITKRVGYDNQPSFLPDGQSLLFTSQREGDQTDIFRYDLRTGATTRLTSTPESEYSPTLMPGGKFFSVVRVEADKTQRLWKFPLAGGALASLVLDNVKPVGYHLWLDQFTLALFVLGDEKTKQPNTLQLVTLAKDRPTAIEESTEHVNVGRSLQRVPRRTGAFSFVHKTAPDEWLIKIIDVPAHRTELLTRTLPGSEDLAWLPDGSVLMARDTKLFRFDPASEHAWQEIADFAAAGLRRITRLALSPKGDRLALVAQNGLSQ
ncbi:MAG: TolB family protein [Pyrinomonadaceae bacterium]